MLHYSEVTTDCITFTDKKWIPILNQIAMLPKYFPNIVPAQFTHMLFN